MRPGDEGSPPADWWAWHAIQDNQGDWLPTGSRYTGPDQSVGEVYFSSTEAFQGEVVALVDSGMPSFELLIVFESGKALGLRRDPNTRPHVEAWDLARCDPEDLAEMYDELA